MRTYSRQGSNRNHQEFKKDCTRLVHGPSVIYLPLTILERELFQIDYSSISILRPWSTTVDSVYQLILLGPFLRHRKPSNQDIFQTQDQELIRLTTHASTSPQWSGFNGPDHTLYWSEIWAWGLDTCSPSYSSFVSFLPLQAWFQAFEIMFLSFTGKHNGTDVC